MQAELFWDAATGPALPANNAPVAARRRPMGTALPVPVVEPLTAQETAADRSVKTGLTLGDLWVLRQADRLA